MNNATKKIVILGAGGQARETLWAFQAANEDKKQWDILGFIDEDEKKHGTQQCEIPVLGGFDWFENTRYSDLFVICAVGSPSTKKQFIAKAKRYQLHFCSIVHPSVEKSKFVNIGRGTTVGAGSILTTQITIGDHVLINKGCTLGHDSWIEDYCTIAPGANISGSTHFEEGVDFGTGAVIIQNRTVGKWSIIGAGAVVISDIPAYCTAVGVPAKVIKTHADKEEAK